MTTSGHTLAGGVRALGPHPRHIHRSLGRVSRTDTAEGRQPHRHIGSQDVVAGADALMRQIHSSSYQGWGTKPMSDTALPASARARSSNVVGAGKHPCNEQSAQRHNTCITRGVTHFQKRAGGTPGAECRPEAQHASSTEPCNMHAGVHQTPMHGHGLTQHTHWPQPVTHNTVWHRPKHNQGGHAQPCSPPMVVVQRIKDTPESINPSQCEQSSSALWQPAAACAAPMTRSSRPGRELDEAHGKFVRGAHSRCWRINTSVAALF